jgi:hypothetical protein
MTAFRGLREWAGNNEGGFMDNEDWRMNVRHYCHAKLKKKSLAPKRCKTDDDTSMCIDNAQYTYLQNAYYN